MHGLSQKHVFHQMNQHFVNSNFEPRRFSKPTGRWNINSAQHDWIYSLKLYFEQSKRFWRISSSVIPQTCGFSKSSRSCHNCMQCCWPPSVSQQSQTPWGFYKEWQCQMKYSLSSAGAWYLSVGQWDELKQTALSFSLRPVSYVGLR